MKKIFYILSRFPFPQTGGREKMLNEYLDYLKNEPIELHIYAFDKRGDQIPEISNFIKTYGGNVTVQIFKIPSNIKVLINIIIQSIIKKEKSLQESLYYSFQKQAYLLNEIEVKRPDIIFCDLLRTAQYVDKIVRYPGLLTIFAMDDLFSKRYNILRGVKEGDVLGNMNKKSSFATKIMKNHTFRNILLSFESKRVGKNEVKYANKFDKTLLVSPIEANEFQANVKRKSIYFLYPSANIIYEKPTIRKNDNQFSLSYMGFLGSAHNERGLAKFLDCVFCKLIIDCPEISLTIVGEGLSANLETIIEKIQPHINVLGYVEDFKAALLATNIFVAPTYFGTGIKTKIIDAMGLGMPIATTAAAVEGLKVKHEENIMIANDDQEFIDNIKRLIFDFALNEKIQKNAHAYVIENHNKRKLKKDFLNLLEL